MRIRGTRRCPAVTNLVVFAFDAGTELREHHSLQPHLLQVLEGAVAVSVEGARVELQPRGLLHIESTIRHSVSAAAPASLLLTVLLIDSPGESHICLAD